MAETPKYELGEHEAWESALHHYREQQALLKAPATAQEELRFLERFITKHRLKASLPVVCKPCKRQIQKAQEEGFSPWTIPLEVQDTVLSFARTHRIRLTQRK